jgi:hypothetical protein
MSREADPGRAQKFVSVLNMSGETIPAWAAMEPYGVDGSGALMVRKPTVDDSPTALLNGGSVIGKGDYGAGTYHMATWAYYNVADGTPATGESIGTRAGYWPLYRGYEGFLVWGGAFNSIIQVQRDVTCRSLTAGGYGGYGYYPHQKATRPCGCRPCGCCPGICWWKTDWPKQWTTAHGRYATGIPTPTWTMTTFSMTLAGPFDDFYWGCEVVFNPDACLLGFCLKLLDNCNTQSGILISSGTVAWTSGATTKTFDIRFTAAVGLNFSCDNPDQYLVASYGGLECDDPTFSAFIVSMGGNADYLLPPEDGLDQFGVDTSSCSFTATTSLTGQGLPAMTITGVA